MMVAIAAQRNQNSAVGAITFVIAGFSGSGIFGIEGVCTKLKYQSRPIHITPEVTCSQRMANSHHACSPSATLPPTPARMISRMMSRTAPAVIVLPRDWKKAPIVFSFWFMGPGEKSLAPSGLPGQQPARGGEQHHELQQRDRRLQPVALGDERGQQARIAERRDQSEQRDRGEVESVAVAQLAEPGPAAGRAGHFDKAVDRQLPIPRQLLHRHIRRQRAADVKQERDQRNGEARPGGAVQPERIQVVDAKLAPPPVVHIHPSPRDSARNPASSMTTMTRRRTTGAGMVPSSFAPRREPSITPRIAGTTTSGSSAPRWM